MGAYVSIVLALHVPAVKTYVGRQASSALGKMMNTEVSIGSVDLGMLNRLVIDDVLVKDQNGADMLATPRMSVKINIRDLLRGKISISSAQIFGLKAVMYKKTADDAPNFQFVIDAFSSNDTTKNSTIDLKISSLVIRRSEVSYNQLDAPDDGTLSPKHINLRNISAHLILNTLTGDSLNVNVKRVSLNDKSGLNIRRLSLKLAAGRSGALLSDFCLQLPRSQLKLDLSADYHLADAGSQRQVASGDSLTFLEKLPFDRLTFEGSITETSITPSDLSALVPGLRSCHSPVEVSAQIEGTKKSASITRLAIRQQGNLSLSATASAVNLGGHWQWEARLQQLDTSSDGIENIVQSLSAEKSLPTIARNIGDISLSADATGIDSNFGSNISLNTTAGNIGIQMDKAREKLTASLVADNIDLRRLTGNDDLGNVEGKISAEGILSEGKPLTGHAVAMLEKFDYRRHSYNGINIEADYKKDGLSTLSALVADKGGDIDLRLTVDKSRKSPSVDAIPDNHPPRIPYSTFDIAVSHFQPRALNLSEKWKDGTFDFTMNGNIRASDIEDATGEVHVKDFSMISEDGDYCLSALDLAVGRGPSGQKEVVLKSDFASLKAEGDFRYSTLFDSFKATLTHRLPTLPGVAARPHADNSMTLYATITKTDWLERLLTVPLTLTEPAHLIVDIDDATHKADINFDAQEFSFGGRQYRDAYVITSTANDTLKVKLNVTSVDDKENSSNLSLSARAADGHVISDINVDSHGKEHIQGVLNSDARFFKNDEGNSVAELTVFPSEVHIGDSIWNIDAARLTYYKDYLAVDNFTIGHDAQYINVNGVARKNTSDAIIVDMKDVNVSYILDLVNFHSVEFAGYASGEVKVRDLFTSPDISTLDLKVDDFHIEGGPIGTLHTAVAWNVDDGYINIDGVSTEDEDHYTVIKGYVSPKYNCIDLGVTAIGSCINFVGNYCEAFAHDFDMKGWGHINVVGPLKEIQIVGDAVATGDITITALNTTYHVQRQAVKFIPDDMQFIGDTITDRDGHIGIVTAHLRHEHLHRLTYDISIDAHNLLAMDTHTFGEETFYGTIYATGSCDIRGRSGIIIFDIKAVPEEGSTLVYNASSPDRILDSFIHWTDRDEQPQDDDGADNPQGQPTEIESDMYMNFLIDCNQNATLQLLMDEKSGDYIALNGDGFIRATYYNKGDFNMFGNYIVDHGVYKMTIQDVMKRDFSFKQGGTITFGGNAFNAGLNLQAVYSLSSVPLSDINIGQSFSNNNVPVDCIMNITGTPGSPKVDFSIDMPTVSGDAKQMIMSVMRDNEEINQQAVYLLAVGRFLNQQTGTTSGSSSSHSQTSLAMQNILSGTVSQQLNTMLEDVIGSKQWNFGANISPGDEGFDNAEYEGLVSGRMFNNRLVFNGQFGYRDNPNATSSFIGDFDLQYLLVPTGSVAIRVYNQTNNKYFTKNTLNTQGVGFVIKKDFNGWRDFFRWKKQTGVR